MYFWHTLSKTKLHSWIFQTRMSYFNVWNIYLDMESGFADTALTIFHCTLSINYKHWNQLNKVVSTKERSFKMLILALTIGHFKQIYV